MKTLYALLFLFIISSCGTKPVSVKQDSSVKDTVVEHTSPVEKIESLTLPSDYQQQALPAKVVKGKVTCSSNADIYTAGMDDNEGERDQIIIQTGDTGMMLEMYVTKLSLTEAIKSVTHSMWTPLKKMITQEANLAIFTRGTASHGSNDSYDFILMIQKEGIQYRVNPSDSRDYTKQEIELLLAIAKSIEL